MATGFLEYETLKTSFKSSKNFKHSVHDVVSEATNFSQNKAFYVSIGCVRLAGKVLW